MVFYAMYGYTDYFGEVLYGLDTISELLNENLFLFSDHYILASIVCISIIYQFFYVVFGNKKGRNRVDFSRFFFILTLLFYSATALFIVYSMIFGISGLCFFSCSNNIVYGFEAFESAIFLIALMSMIFPIIPFLIIYDIIYIIIRRKRGMRLLGKSR